MWSMTWLKMPGCIILEVTGDSELTLSLPKISPHLLNFPNAGMLYEVVPSKVGLAVPGFEDTSGKAITRNVVMLKVFRYMKWRS